MQLENESDQLLIALDDEPKVSNFRIVDELDPSGRPTGFKLGLPSEEEQRKMEEEIGDELDNADKEYDPLRAAWERNIRAFEALPEGDKEDFLTLPVAKTAIYHLVAFHVNRIYNARPIGTVDPEEYGMYQVPVPTGRDPFTGEIMSRVELRSAEEIAEGGERLLQHYLRKKIPFHKFLYSLILDAHVGAPGWGETCYERTLRPQYVPKWRNVGGMIVQDGYTEVERVIGSPHKLIAHSAFDVMMAAPWLDQNEADWISKAAPHTAAEAHNRIKFNDWYLVGDEDEEDLRKAYSDLNKRYPHRAAVDDAKERKVDQERKMLDVHYVWKYWPAVVEDANGQEIEGLFSFLIPFERTTRKMLACPLNPYAHGRRTLVPYYQRPKPHSFGSYSTLDDVLPLQKVKTRLFHSQVQNAMLANTVFAKVRPGSTAWQWLKSNEVRARSKIPVQNDNDFKSETLGRELRSLQPEIQAIDAWQKDLTVSDTVRGATLLGRTSRASISLVQEAGLTVPNMDLDFLRDSLSQNLTMLFHDIGQWSVYGESIPFTSAEDRAVMMKAVEFPLEGLNTFSVRISASSDEETAQFEFERNLGLAKLQAEAFQTELGISGPMLNPNAPPAVVAFHKRQLIAHYLMHGRIYELAKMDPKKFTLTEREIEALIEQQRAFVEQQKQQAMEEQIRVQSEAIRRANAGGGGAVVPGAFGRGPVPAPLGEANAPAAPLLGEGPGNAGVPPPAAGNGL